MNIKAFFTSLEHYFEQKYSLPKLQILEQYLAKQERDHDLGPKYRRHLLAQVMFEFSGQYKTLPDIAIFEKCKQSAIDEMISEQRKETPSRMMIEEKTVPIEEVQAFFDNFMEMIKSKNIT